MTTFTEAQLQDYLNWCAKTKTANIRDGVTCLSAARSDALDTVCRIGEFSPVITSIANLSTCFDEVGEIITEEGGDTSGITIKIDDSDVTQAITEPIDDLYSEKAVDDMLSISMPLDNKAITFVRKTSALYYPDEWPYDVLPNGLDDDYLDSFLTVDAYFNKVDSLSPLLLYIKPSTVGVRDILWINKNVRTQGWPDSSQVWRLFDEVCEWFQNSSALQQGLYDSITAILNGQFDRARQIVDDLGSESDVFKSLSMLLAGNLKDLGLYTYSKALGYLYSCMATATVSEDELRFSNYSPIVAASFASIRQTITDTLVSLVTTILSSISPIAGALIGAVSTVGSYLFSGLSEIIDSASGPLYNEESTFQVLGIPIYQSYITLDGSPSGASDYNEDKYPAGLAADESMVVYYGYGWRVLSWRTGLTICYEVYLSPTDDAFGPMYDVINYLDGLGCKPSYDSDSQWRSVTLTGTQLYHIMEIYDEAQNQSSHDYYARLNSFMGMPTSHQILSLHGCLFSFLCFCLCNHAFSSISFDLLRDLVDGGDAPSLTLGAGGYMTFLNAQPAAELVCMNNFLNPFYLTGTSYDPLSAYDDSYLFLAYCGLFADLNDNDLITWGPSVGIEVENDNSVWQSYDYRAIGSVLNQLDWAGFTNFLRRMGAGARDRKYASWNGLSFSCQFIGCKGLTFNTLRQSNWMWPLTADYDSSISIISGPLKAWVTGCIGAETSPDRENPWVLPPKYDKEALQRAFMATGIVFAAVSVGAAVGYGLIRKRAKRSATRLQQQALRNRNALLNCDPNDKAAWNSAYKKYNRSMNRYSLVSWIGGSSGLATAGAVTPRSLFSGNSSSSESSGFVSNLLSTMAGSDLIDGTPTATLSEIQSTSVDSVLSSQSIYAAITGQGMPT